MKVKEVEIVLKSDGWWRFACGDVLKQKLKFCSSLTHIFDEKKVSIFFKNKPVWRIFSPGFMFSEMNLWKFRHYFWQFRHYFWKLDFSSTLMLKLMETLFFKHLCRTPAYLPTVALFLNGSPWGPFWGFGSPFYVLGSSPFSQF